MSTTVQFTATKLYKVKPGSPVSLTVIIGEGNVGGTTVVWNDKSIVQNSDQITDMAIGAQGDNLQGKLLFCTTNVQDINPASNKTSVTYILSGGEEQQEFPFQIDVAGNGGFAIYSITFGFY